MASAVVSFCTMEMTGNEYRKRRNVYLACAVGIQLLGILQFLLFLVTVPVGLFFVLTAAWWQAHIKREPHAGSRALDAGSVLLTAAVGATATAAAMVGASYVASALGHGFSRGRQIRIGGRVVLPELEDDSAWSDRNAAPSHHLPVLEADVRAALARRWRENGKTEHASVAAFAKLTLDLMELGAPPALLEAASRDGADEIRHARMCFALARALDGEDEGPTAFPAVKTSSPVAGANALLRLAVDSLFDGVVHEGLSARVLARLARRCEVPSIAAMLREIAADEGRHAAHAWDVVEHCAALGGQPVLEALQGAVAAIPEHHESDLPEAARDGAWERWGIHGVQLERECHAATLELTRARVAALSAGMQAAA